jgi:hypothetical protein
MSKKKRAKDEERSAEQPQFFRAVILERLRRLNSFPLHPLDWRTEYALNHFLNGKNTSRGIKR